MAKKEAVEEVEAVEVVEEVEAVEVVEEVEAVEAVEVVEAVQSKFKCDNCEDSGMVCYQCK